jgi:hypothetical protein
MNRRIAGLWFSANDTALKVNCIMTCRLDDGAGISAPYVPEREEAPACPRPQRDSPGLFEHV